jgi:hypothetical protein
MNKYLVLDWNGDTLALADTEQKALEIGKAALMEDAAWDEDDRIYVYELKGEFKIQSSGISLVRVKK